MNAKVGCCKDCVAECVDDSKGIVELDAIKRNELTIPEDDVVQVKIAMALANVLLPFSGREFALDGAKAVARPVLEQSDGVLYASDGGGLNRLEVVERFGENHFGRSPMAAW